jgi:hypothetical protein
MKDQLKGFHFKDVAEVQVASKIMQNEVMFHVFRNVLNNCMNIS